MSRIALEFRSNYSILFIKKFDENVDECPTGNEIGYFIYDFEKETILMA